MYNLSTDNDEEALLLIEKIYHHTEDKNEILAFLKKQVKKTVHTERKESYLQSLFGKKYIRATLMACLISSSL